MRDQVLLERAKSMRREQTGPEQRLWLALRAKRFEGAKFRRQVVIGRYIADFACRTPAKVVIEIDGETHAGRAVYDEERSAFLRRHGYEVVRFLNSDVMTNLDGVLAAIGTVLRSSPLPTLSPEGRGRKDSNAALPFR